MILLTTQTKEKKMDKDELPMLIIKLLAHGIKVSPFQLPYILKMYDIYHIPDKELDRLNMPTLDAYQEGLYYSGQDGAGDWTRGHNILESIGFTKVKRRDGHRIFTKLIWDNESA